MFVSWPMGRPGAGRPTPCWARLPRARPRATQGSSPGPRRSSSGTWGGSDLAGRRRAPAVRGGWAGPREGSTRRPGDRSPLVLSGPGTGTRVPRAASQPLLRGRAAATSPHSSQSGRRRKGATLGAVPSRHFQTVTRPGASPANPSAENHEMQTLRRQLFLPENLTYCFS